MVHVVLKQKSHFHSLKQRERQIWSKIMPFASQKALKLIKSFRIISNLKLI